MNKIYSVIRNEIITGLRNKSFTIMAFGVPLIIVLVFLATMVLGGSRTVAESETGDEYETTLSETAGYVDTYGFITALPDDLPTDRLKVYPSETAANKALEEGLISGFFLIPEEFVATGELTMVRNAYNPFSDEDPAELMRWVLLFNLMEGDMALAGQVLNPMDLDVIDITPAAETESIDDCSRPGPGCESNTLVRYIPFATLVLFYIFIATASGLLLRGMGKEKENRVIEILLSSVSPRQMLAGKIIGLGVLGFLQFVVWTGTGFLMLQYGGQTLSLPDNFEMPSSFLIWGLLYFLVGYAMYASLMAGAGAIIPSLKEVTQASLVAASPLLIGYMIGLIMVQEPHSILITSLSLFPLTAPVVMMMRLVGGGVPLWQSLLSLGLMVLTSYLIFRAVAAMFHAQHLLSGQPFNARRFIKVLLTA